MGFSISWIGVYGVGRERILNAVGLIDAPKGCRKPKAVSWSLPNGWSFLLTQDFAYPTPGRMSALSAGGRAIALSADDRVMYSVIRGYENGVAVFAIEHDGGQHGVRHMATLGKLPPEWTAIRKRLSQRQTREDRGAAEVDFMFDAPVELAKAICGYRFDEDWPKGQAPEETALVVKNRLGVLGLIFSKR